MSDTVDDRVVGMRFNNSAFERGVRTTMSTLDKLKSSLNFGNQKKGLDELQGSADRFHMGKMGVSIEGISTKLLALGTIGVTALTNITNRAVNAGLQMAKSLTIAPITDGFHEYETQLNSVQTILANTGLKGSSGMGQVNKSLNELNTYSDKTIYNFSEMAKNIGTFTAAGVKLKPATSAIKGIANVAALSGSSSEQASTAMYQLSQAIANNKVGLQDWNSVVNAGMGGKVFQSALFNVAKMKGTLKGVDANTTFDQWTKAGNSFRDSLKSGWITGDVLTTTLSQFTGDLTDAQLKSQGYNATQIKQIQEQAKTAGDAATKVKTFTQLMGTLKEAVGSGWSQSFLTIFGNFDEAKTLWTGVSNSIGGLIQNSSKARNKVLSDWKALGGRTVLIDAIQNSFKALSSVVKPIKDAFREIFPAQTGKTLYDLTVRFRDFMAQLKIGAGTADNLKRTFKGVFAIFDILKQVLGGVFHMFGTLFHAISGGSGSFLGFTGSIGDMLVAFDQTLKSGGGITAFFGGLGKILAVPIKLLGVVRNFVLGLFTGFDGGGASAVQTAIEGVSGSLSGLSHLGDNVQKVWDRVVAAFSKVQQKLQPFTDGIKRMFSSLGNTLSDTMSSAGFDNIIKLFNTVLLGGITLAIKKFLGKGINIDVGGGFLGSIKESFSSLTDTMKAMQQQLKAKALMEIAIAVGVLAASVALMATINPKKLTPAIQALALLFTQLLIGMGILTKITSTAGFIKLPVMAASMILLSSAVLILTVALRNLASLDWESLKKGMIGVGVLLTELTLATVAISLASGNMARTSLGIIALAVAVKVLVSAVQGMAGLSWGDLVKGLTGVGGALVVISGAMRLMPPGLALTGLGLLAISAGLTMVASAVKSFASLDLKQLGMGLLGIASSMGVIAGMMRLMPEGMVAQAAGLILVGIALNSIAKAVGTMGNFNWKQIAKGLTALAGSMAILAIGLDAMVGALPGAAALFVAAGALTIFVPVLKALGKMSWQQIVTGLLALAGTFLVIGGSAAILSPLTPVIAALGLALLAFGAAVALVGVGVLALGKGFQLLATGGAEGVKVLLAALDGFISRLPQMLSALANGLVQFVSIIVKNAPGMIGGMAKVLQSLMQAIIDSLPKALELFTKLISTFTQAILTNAPKIASAALQLIIDFLNAVAQKGPDLIDAGARAVIAFLDGLGRNAGKIADHAFAMIVKFLNGIADAIDKHEQDILKAGARIGWALIHGLVGGLGDLISWAWGQIGHFFSWIWDKIKGFFGINSPSTAMEWIGNQLVYGLWNGITKLAGWVWNKLKGFLGDIWDQFTSFFDIFSPSKKMAWIGEMLVRGLGVGVDDNGHIAVKSAANMSKGVMDAVSKTMSKLPAAIEGAGQVNLQPTITPVLDLSNVQKDAGKIGGLMKTTTFSASLSFSTASAISADQAAADTTATASVTKEIKFEQNNYSPKALSPAEVYRNTRNQISMAKEALNA